MTEKDKIFCKDMKISQNHARFMEKMLQEQKKNFIFAAL